MFDNVLAIYGLVFIAALLVIDSALRFVMKSNRRSSDVKNRLQALKQRSNNENQVFAQLLSRRGLGGRGGEQSVDGIIGRFISQTGLEISAPRRIFYILALFLIGFGFAMAFLGTNIVVHVIFGILFAAGTTVWVVNYVRNRRIKTFTTQLAPALDMIVRSLNAGHPLNTAIALVAREMPDPLGSEFGILNDQMTFGLDIEKAMLNMVDRVGATELNLLTVTVTVQRGTGGNLAEILENLARMIRDRQMTSAKIRAISAEGRVTSWVMVSFPFILYFMLIALVPDYFDEVWASGYGEIIVATCLSLVFFGMLVIRRMVNFDF